MLLDKNNLFSIAQDLAKANAVYLSDFSIDTGPTGTIPAMFQSPGQTGLRRVGAGEAKECIIQVVTSFTTGAGGTLKVDLVMADDAALTSNLTVLDSSPVIAAATLVAGYRFAVAAKLPDDLLLKRYIGLQYTIGTGAMTAGKITAGLVFDKQTSFTP